MKLLLKEVMAEDSINDVQEYIEQCPVLKAFLAGSISGTCSTVLFQPLDVVKTRLQSSACLTSVPRSNTVGMMNIVSGIIEKERIPALWKGMTPSLTRCVPGVGVYFATMHWMKSTCTDGRPSPTEALIIGMAARSVSSVSLIPISVIKTRFESNEYSYNGVRQALKVIYRAEGLRGLSSGLVPTLLRDAPFSGLYLVFYSQLKYILHQDLLNGELSAPSHFSCGVLAGMLASLVTQPADVIKTKLQLYPGRFETTLQVLLYIQQKFGIKGYFKGLIPRMLRRTLIAAMAWTMYEQLTQSIGLK